MKSIKYLGLGLIATTVLGAAAPAAFADDVREGESKTTVEIVKHEDDEKAKDELNLNEVPTQWDFKTSSKANGEYTLTAENGKYADGSEKQFVVFANKKGQEWSVKSVLKDGVLTKLAGSGPDTVPVTRVAFVAADGAKNVTKPDLTVAGDLNGTIMTSVTNSIDYDGANPDYLATLEITGMEVDFKLANAQVGDIYQGVINHTLYSAL